MSELGAASIHLIAASSSAVPDGLVVTAAVVSILSGSFAVLGVGGVAGIVRQVRGRKRRREVGLLGHLRRRLTEERQKILGGDGTATNFRFEIAEASDGSQAHPPHETRSLSRVGDFWSATTSRRMVVTGPPGSGKTALAYELSRELFSRRRWVDAAGDERQNDLVPIVISASTWAGTDSDLYGGVKSTLQSWFGINDDAANDLVDPARTVLILDGVNEMDERGSGARNAVRLFERCNAEMGEFLGIILTCDTDTLAEVRAQRCQLQNSITVSVLELEVGDVENYLQRRSGNVDDWRGVIDQIRRDPDSSLSQVLIRPFWLNLAAAACGRRREAALRPKVVRRADLVKGLLGDSPSRLLDLRTRSEIREYLLEEFLESATSSFSGRGIWLRKSRKRQRVEGSLPFIARYLGAITHPRYEGPGSGSLITPHRLWPSCGWRRVRVVDFAISVAVAAPGLGWVIHLAWGRSAPVFAFSIFASVAFIGFACRIGLKPWVAPRQWDVLGMFSAGGLAILAASSAVAFAAWIAFNWVVAVAVLIAVFFGGGLSVGVTQKLVSRNFYDSADPSGPLKSELFVSMSAASAGAPLVAISMQHDLGLFYAAVLAVCYSVLVGATVASAVWRRYVAFLIVSRGRLPVGLLAFLEAAKECGLLRQSGIGYQFRHSELQSYFAAGATTAFEGGW